MSAMAPPPPGLWEKTMPNRNLRKDVENDEKNYGKCEKCCDAGRGNIAVDDLGMER